jgi:hypothetical protein
MDVLVERHRLVCEFMQLPAHDVHAIDPVFEESPMGHGKYVVSPEVGQYAFAGHVSDASNWVEGQYPLCGHATAAESPGVGQM